MALMATLRSFKTVWRLVLSGIWPMCRILASLCDDVSDCLPPFATLAFRVGYPVGFEAK
jgi:hypothetical protein